MPAKSLLQQRFMQVVAHNPKFAKKVGVSKKIGEEFSGDQPLNSSLPIRASKTLGKMKKGKKNGK